jgi:hypothetical protein
MPSDRTGPSGPPSALPSRKTLLVDVNGLDLGELMRAKDSPLLLSLQRLGAETDSDAVAGFSQGLS